MAVVVNALILAVILSIMCDLYLNQRGNGNPGCLKGRTSNN